MTEDDRPDWWRVNEALREDMGLSTYVPPRFEDGEWVHEIVAELERLDDCDILFVGVNSRYPDDWEVRIDGQSAFSIGRHRDENGNTVFEMTGDEFRKGFEAAISSR